MIFNYQFIPFLVNKTGEFSDFELKSDKHISNMKKYYFFFLLVGIVLPITGLTTVGSVIEMSVNGGIMELHSMITTNLVKQSTFFIRYIMSCSFMSSCFLIFDIGHQMYRLVFQGGFYKGLRT